MTAALSQIEREGAARTQFDVDGYAPQPAFHLSSAHRQGIDYEKPARPELTPAVGVDAKTVRIVSGPISLRTLAFWGVVIFIAGFFHGRQMSLLGTRAAESVSRESAPAAQAATVTAPAPTQESSTATVTPVTIRLVKFLPETIEVSTGQTVEWANNDLTPHTVTSQGTGDLNSGSIDAGSSWRHTFTKAGSFQYYCTFHPEMKGTVIVK
jgi:plastocyanin